MPKEEAFKLLRELKTADTKLMSLGMREQKSGLMENLDPPGLHRLTPMPMKQRYEMYRDITQN